MFSVQSATQKLSASNNILHERMVKAELKQVGVTRYGMLKFAVRYLPKVIQPGEHIGGVVYGRYRDKTGSLSLNAGLLVATDKKIIFLDHKPGYTHKEEVAYEAVSGLAHSTAIFSRVKLYTRADNYILRFANPKCADNFVRFVEARRLESARK